MTYRSETPEITLLKSLRYNHYIDIGTFQFSNGIVNDVTSAPQPSIEAFLTSKERFNFEIEIMTVQRGGDGKPNDLIPVKQVIQVTGLGLPNIVDSIRLDGLPNEDTTKTLKFVDFKVVESSITDVNDYGEYWSDDVTNITTNPSLLPFERVVTVPITKTVNRFPVEATGSGGGGQFVFTDDSWSYDGSGYTPVYNNYWVNTISGQVLDIACYIP